MSHRRKRWISKRALARVRQRLVALLVHVLTLPRRDKKGGNNNLSKVAEDTRKRHQALVTDPADCRVWKSGFDADYVAWLKEEGVYWFFDSEYWIRGLKLVWWTGSVERRMDGWTDRWLSG
jgi:hypothetical protein